MDQMLKNLPAMQETQVPSLGQEDPLEKEWQPTLVFLPGESHGQRSLVGYSPRDSELIQSWFRGAWWATVHGIQSWTKLSDLHYCNNMYPSFEFIIQNNFSFLKILYAPRIHPFLLQSLETTDLFTVSIVLPFLECHKDGIIQYVAFSERLLPLSNMH